MVLVLEERSDLSDFGDLMDLRDDGAEEAGLKEVLEGVGGRERFSQAPRRPGMVGVGGVMGLESRGPLKVRFGGSSRSGFDADAGFGGVGSGLATRGAENAEPMSDKVSERTFIRREGAMAGTWDDGDGGGRLSKREP